MFLNLKLLYEICNIECLTAVPLIILQDSSHILQSVYMYQRPADQVLDRGQKTTVTDKC